MSVGPLGGLFGSVAGSPVSQSSGPDAQRARQDAAAQQREVQSGQQAENAAGIAQTDGEDHQSHERDADGRRPWEAPGRKPTDEQPPTETPPVRQSKDPSGQSGGQLDVTG